ncbi:MAG: hypothetical protein ABH879_07130 [archaeon]
MVSRRTAILEGIGGLALLGFGGNAARKEALEHFRERFLEERLRATQGFRLQQIFSEADIPEIQALGFMLKNVVRRAGFKTPAFMLKNVILTFFACWKIPAEFSAPEKYLIFQCAGNPSYLGISIRPG